MFKKNKTNNKLQINDLCLGGRGKRLDSRVELLALNPKGLYICDNKAGKQLPPSKKTSSHYSPI